MSAKTDEKMNTRSHSEHGCQALAYARALILFERSGNDMFPYKKIAVIGCPGSGKTTFSKKTCSHNRLTVISFGFNLLEK